jgi:tetratricopeptide (TPR) repeat protein
LADQARVRGAVPQMEEVAARWTEILAGEDKIWCCEGSARFYQSLNLFNQVKDSRLRSLEICKTQLQKHHEISISSLNNLAELYRLLGNFDAAKPLLEEASTLCGIHDHLNKELRATVLVNMGGLLRETGNYDAAQTCFHSAWDILKDEFNIYATAIATICNQLGLLNTDLFFVDWDANYAEKAEQLFQYALTIYKKELGEGHPYTLATLNNCYPFYLALQRFDEAESFLLEIIKSKRNCLGHEHLSTAASLTNLGTFYSMRERFPDAITVLSEALAIWENSLGPNHPNTIIAREALEDIQN